jgi:hypothetical protein
MWWGRYSIRIKSKEGFTFGSLVLVSKSAVQTGKIFVEVARTAVLYIGCSELRLIGHWLNTSHKHTEQSTIEASVTLYGVTLTDSLIRCSPNEWPLVCREIPVSADKMFATSKKPAQWIFYSFSIKTAKKEFDTISGIGWDGLGGSIRLWVGASGGLNCSAIGGFSKRAHSKLRAVASVTTGSESLRRLFLGQCQKKKYIYIYVKNSHSSE